MAPRALPQRLHPSRRLGSFGTIDAITAWVERGQAPDRLLASGRALPGVSRSLCVYPATASYTGGGAPNDARNFAYR